MSIPRLYRSHLTSQGDLLGEAEEFLFRKSGGEKAKVRKGRLFELCL